LHRFELAGDRGDADNRRALVARTCWRSRRSSNVVLRELGSGPWFKQQPGTQVDKGSSSGPRFKSVASSRGATGGRRSERGGRPQHVLLAWNYSSFSTCQLLLFWRRTFAI
jgi:hypothetical protein